MAFFEKKINLISDENNIALVDTWLNFDTDVETEFSEYPIEADGENPSTSIIDHILPKPLQFRLTGHKADFDLRDSSRSNVIPGYVYDANVTGRLWDTILEATTNGHVFTVVTPTKEYPNMVIKRVKSGMNKETGFSLRFELFLQEVIYGSVDNQALNRVFTSLAQTNPRRIFNRGNIVPTFVNAADVLDRANNVVRDYSGLGINVEGITDEERVIMRFLG